MFNTTLQLVRVMTTDEKSIHLQARGSCHAIKVKEIKKGCYKKSFLVTYLISYEMNFVKFRQIIKFLWMKYEEYLSEKGMCRCNISQ